MDLLTYWVYRLAGGLVGRLPLGVGIRVGRLVGLLGYYLMGGYRRIALRNLAVAFPAMTSRERRARGRRHFATLTGNIFAGERISRMSLEKMKGLVEVEGLEHVRALTARNRGVVLVISHIGNWELFAQLAPGFYGRPCGAIFQRLRNRYMDAHIRRTRGRLGLELFERKDGFGRAAEMLAAGGGVGILIDQHAGDAGIWCPLFGRLASTSPLAATLAQRSGAGLVPAATYTNGIGRWKVVIDPPVEPVRENSDQTTALLNLALERQITRNPDDWFWVHRRWKTPKPRFLLANCRRGIVTTPDPGARSNSPEGERFAHAEGKRVPAAGLQPFRILIRSANWLGDAVMTVPAVRAIKGGRPDAHVTVLTPEKLADFWKVIPEVDEVIPFRTRGGSGFLKAVLAPLQILRVAARLRARRFEAAVLFPNSLRAGLEIWLAGIPRRVGYEGHFPRRILLDQILKTPNVTGGGDPGQRAHQRHVYLKLASFIGARVTNATDEAFTGANGAANPATQRPVRIAVCPGAEYGPAKRWLPERFAEVIRKVNANAGCEWYLVGTAKDRPVAEEIERLAGEQPGVTNLCGSTTLSELIALLRRCSLLVTNDTGTMHLAALLGVRTVAIFGSTDPLLTGPPGSGHTILRRKVECSPCFLRECPIDFRCMKAIEAADVITAIETIIGREVAGTVPNGGGIPARDATSTPKIESPDRASGRGLLGG